MRPVTHNICLFFLTSIRIVIKNRSQQVVSGVEMRLFFKSIVVILACLMSVCMACSELNELVSLQDDASNDFTYQFFPGLEQVNAAIAAAKTPRQPRREAPKVGRPESASLVQASPAPAAASNPLQYSTVLRT